jgi:hypothetical protein
MKWSSKSFVLQLIFAFLGALTFTVIISQVLVLTKGDHGQDFTRLSIFNAGIVYPWIHAFVGGWKNLNPKALFLVCFIITGLFTGQPAAAFFGVIISAFLYLGAGKIRNMIYFYRNTDSSSPENPKPDR